MKLFESIHKLNTFRLNYEELEQRITAQMSERLDLFVKEMNEIENGDPYKKIWSRSNYPHRLSRDNNSSFTINLGLKDGLIKISWFEEEFRCGSCDSRGGEFSIDPEFFEVDDCTELLEKYKNELKKEVKVAKEKYKEEVSIKKQETINRLTKELESHIEN